MSNNEITIAEEVAEPKYSVTAKEYFDFCGTTAFYPEDKAIDYLTHGLTSEAGEVAGTVLDQSATFADLMKEVGDCQWYVARQCHHLRIDFEELVTTANLLVDNTEARYIPNQCILLMCKEAGEVAGRVKKSLRDGAAWEPSHHQDNDARIEHHLISFVIATMHLINSVNMIAGTAYSYHQVLTINRDKLQSRKDRAVLGGDGDKR